jgi:hypothetical protein
MKTGRFMGGRMAQALTKKEVDREMEEIKAHLSTKKEEAKSGSHGH